jgi:glycosyltransferase involved in cell wall biosynthesis
VSGPDRPAPDVSVVIPVFDRAHCVPDAVASVLLQAQAGVAVEAIVVDDGSTDGSADAVRSAFPDDPRVVVLQQANQGPSAARNLGTAHATAPLVTYLDSDDVLVPGGLAVQLAVLRAADGPDGVVGGHRLVQVVGPTPDWLVTRPDWMQGPKWTSMLVERRHVEAIGGFDEGMRMAEDIDIVARYREAGLRLDVIEDVVVERRWFGDNLTRELTADFSDVRMVLRRSTARRRAAAAKVLQDAEAARGDEG